LYDARSTALQFLNYTQRLYHEYRRFPFRQRSQRIPKSAQA